MIRLSFSDDIGAVRQNQTAATGIFLLTLVEIEDRFIFYVSDPASGEKDLKKLLFMMSSCSRFDIMTVL